MSIKSDKKNKGKYDGKNAVDIVKGWVETDKADTDSWRNKNDKWYRLRMRVKKPKTKPFVGCSNIRMPTLDTKIKKLKASLISNVFVLL